MTGPKPVERCQARHGFLQCGLPKGHEDRHVNRPEDDPRPEMSISWDEDHAHYPEGEPEAPAPEPSLTREDLEAEHEAMRVTMLNVLMKVGVLDEHSARAPWDGPTLLHFAGMFLTDALPWARNQGYMKTLQVAVNRIGKDLDELKRHVDEINETCWAKAIDEKIQALKDELGTLESLGRLNEANVVDLMHRVESLESKVKE